MPLRQPLSLRSWQGCVARFFRVPFDGGRHQGRLSMLMFKMVVTFLLVWFIAGLVGLVFNSRMVQPRVLTGLTVVTAGALVYFIWLA
jgi:hypothetical protein